MGVSDQLPFAVASHPLGRRSFRLRIAVVEFPAPNVAVVRPSKPAIRLAWILLLLGIGALGCVGLAAYLFFCVLKPGGVWGAAGMAITLIPLMICALWLIPAGGEDLLAVGGLVTTTIDKRGGHIWQEGKEADGASLAAGRFTRDVAAVQICPLPVDGTDWGLEIDLVFSKPPGDRLSLMGHAKEKALRADAKALAEFLNVALLDHSDRFEIQSPHLEGTTGPDGTKRG